MKKYWIWLSQSFPYGSETPRNLLSVFKRPDKIYNATQEELEKLDFLTQKDIVSLNRTSLERAENILNDCNNKKIKVVCFDDEKYPKRLKNIYGAPMVIYVLGNIDGIDEQVAISVVGTRVASEYSMKTLKRLCDDLVKCDVLLISGCAVGIDSVAHKSAVDNKKRTIAVLGCGLDINYPVENRDLKVEILKNGGALISEYPPKTAVKGSNFPIRNRIISALSCGVLIGQAPYRSGSLITANYALEQGKDVFCIPPRDIYDKNYSGVSNLIRDGATSVFGAEDILYEYLNDYPEKLNLEKIILNTKHKKSEVKMLVEKYLPKENKKKIMKTSDIEDILEYKKTRKKEILQNCSDDHKKIFYLLTESPQIIDDIVIKSEMPMAKVSMILLELEMRGLINSHSGGIYTANKL